MKRIILVVFLLAFVFPLNAKIFDIFKKATPTVILEKERLNEQIVNFEKEFDWVNTDNPLGVFDGDVSIYKAPDFDSGIIATAKREDKLFYFCKIRTNAAAYICQAPEIIWQDIEWIKIQAQDKISGWVNKRELSALRKVYSNNASNYILIGYNYWCGEEVPCENCIRPRETAAILISGNNFLHDLNDTMYREWSFKGDKLTYTRGGYVSYGGNRKSLKIYIYSIKDKKEIYVDSGYSPTFSIDGEKILYIKEFNNKNQKTQIRICSKNTDGSDYKELFVAKKDYFLKRDGVGDWTDVINIKSLIYNEKNLYSINFFLSDSEYKSEESETITIDRNGVVFDSCIKKHTNEDLCDCGYKDGTWKLYDKNKILYKIIKIEKTKIKYKAEYKDGELVKETAYR